MTLHSSATTSTAIHLFGFGTVGEGFYLLLHDAPQAHATISNIVVRSRSKARSLPDSAFQFSPEVTPSPFGAPLVVELIDQADDAFAIVSDALRKQIPAVSANKKMIATYLPQLLQLQESSTASLRYEGAVCGSIPILQLLDSYFGQEPLLSIQGIVNGTTNYILSAMQNNHTSYAEALKQAQGEGYAESDPTSDVKAWDAAYKLTLLNLHAFGEIISPKTILRMGIDTLDHSDLAFAKKKNKRIKLLATAQVVNHKLVTYVLPTFVANDSPFYHVDAEYNAIALEGKNVGQQFFKGKGAGAFPTASAVFADVQQVGKKLGYAYTKRKNPTALAADDASFLKVYIRTRTSALVTELPFASVTEGYIDQDYRYIIGTMSVANLKAYAPLIESDGGIIIAL
jgi:homoserine dehydrogenase